MKILIFGSGYVGLTTGVCFALKHDVTLVDIDERKISLIKEKKTPFYEEGLDDLLKRVIEEKNLKILHITESLPRSDLIFVCVGTPSDSDGYIDLKYVHSVMNTLNYRWKEIQNDFTVLVLKSTIIPGTTRKYNEEFRSKINSHQSFGYAFNPEFLAQGSAVKDTLSPSRIIFGADSSKTSHILRKFYTNFYDDKVPIIEMSIESAEFSKYAANCFLATKISFANEFANIVENVPKADIDDIMKGMGFDKRISPTFLRAGIGFGGSCFPKDTKAIIRFAEEQLIHTPELLSAVVKVNQDRHLRITTFLLQALGTIENRKIAVLGLTFKPGTDDTRNAPSIKILGALGRHQADIHVHDPLIKQIDFKNFEGIKLTAHSNKEDCLTNADACLILTEWEEYRKLDLANITSLMRNKIVIDGRRIFAKRDIPTDIIYLTPGLGHKI